MKAKVLISTTLVLLTSGCTVGPNYQSPRVKAPDQWGAPLAGGMTSHDTLTGGWWTGFNDPKLTSLITRAAETNLDLRIAEARVRQARAQYGMARADNWPTVNASGSYSRQKQKNITSNVYEAGFDASWEIDLFGGERRAIEAATADLAAMEYGRRDVLVTLFSEVARNYVQARGTQRQLAILREQIGAQTETVTITRNRVRNGSATDLDLQRALAQLTSLQSQVPALETAILVSAHRLGVLLGQNPDALKEELSDAAPIPASPPVIPVGLPSDLLLRRPDVLQAERKLAAETARIGQTKADLFPRFFLTGAASQNSSKASSFFDSNSTIWSIGPSVQWRIFDASRVRASIQAQTAVQDQAALSYRQVILTSLEDVENALVAYAKEQEHRRLLDQTVAANQAAVDIAQKLYSNGLGKYLDLLDAQRSLYTSQDALVQSECGVSLNLIILYKALGGGWETAKSQLLADSAETAPERAHH
jgi:NodT family efflux transporter outer membrane factor (OMF) lipoprotein